MANPVVLPPIVIVTNSTLPGVPSAAPNKSELIRTIALDTLAELAISLTIWAPVSFFAATPISAAALLALSLVQVAVSAIFRYLEATGKTANFPSWFPKATEFNSGAFAFVAAKRGQTLIHEGGHALAAKALFQNANPRVTVYPLSPSAMGSTEYFSGSLTSFGKRLGKEKSLALVAAAGPIVSLSLSSILFTTGLAIKQSYPKISAYLTAAALQDFATHFFYALSAYWATHSTHDFVRLAGIGISPLMVAVTMAAVPLLIYGVHKWMNPEKAT
jgi:hypothetical protein